MRGARERCAAAALAALGCAVPPPAPARAPERSEAGARIAEAAPATAAARARPTVRRASGKVRVRLTGLDGASPVHVLGTLHGELVLERRGALVRSAADRGASQGSAEVRLAPAPGSRLRAGERSYGGALIVRPRAAGGLEVFCELDLEEYVEGVVASELAIWSAEGAALEAQAIAARSFAIAQLDSRGRSASEPTLLDDVRDQAFRGAHVPDPRSGRAAREVAARLRAAVRRTRGIVLFEDPRVVDARFHAACGGATADGAAVFPEADFACLRSVECAPCRGSLGAARGASPELDWRWTAPRFALERLARELGLGEHLLRLAPARRDSAGRWLEVRLEGESGARTIPFEELRRRLSRKELASSLLVRTWPRAGETIGGGLLFEGRGRGHGVGLCQEGASAWARAGWSAERILAHYYPGAALVDWR
ncbi:MAG TPA: SpoIID/LytB domain-containing protein [Planctomycetota bacterium]|nr:SpoIID/LytB domain-containing protein [Planctomycetota bacterium]